MTGVTKPVCIIRLSGWMIVLFFAGAVSGLCGGIPEKGSTFPPVVLTPPVLDSDLQYLSLEGKTEFSLPDIPADYFVLEIIGVYCAVCFKQAPLYNKLFARLKRMKNQGKIKMLALAAGGTPEETKMLREKGTYKFPVLSDPDYAAHKQIGEPRTPYTLLVDRHGNVLSAHLGMLKDIDSYFEKLSSLPDLD